MAKFFLGLFRIQNLPYIQVSIHTNALYILYAFQHVIILFESQSSFPGQAKHSREKWVLLKDLLLLHGLLETESRLESRTFDWSSNQGQGSSNDPIP